MVIYIAGSMSSLHSDDRQYGLFHARAARFRKLGHRVINPAEKAYLGQLPWSRSIRVCMSQVIKCDAIHFLPVWQCPGPILEYFAALLCHAQVVDQDAQPMVLPAASLSAGEIVQLMVKHG